MARNKSAIIVAGSRFNCYTPSIDFTINIFGHPVSLASLRYCYYYYFLSPFLSFFFFFFIGLFEKCFIARKREVGGGRRFHSLLIIRRFYTIVYSRREFI